MNYAPQNSLQAVVDERGGYSISKPLGNQTPLPPMSTLDTLAHTTIVMTTGDAAYTKDL